ncbi:MAG TPA: HD domain-containing protein, partial [Polyangiaceae bacterium]|nr:HD domain-containing protein [Polyangiaceae bacterium]
MAVSPSPELEALLANVKKSYPDADTAPIELAFEGVTTHLDATAKKRALHAANVLASLRLDPAAVGACLVATFRNQISQADTENQFGKEIAKLVDGVVRVQATRWDRLEQEAAESLRKMFIAMAAEVRVVIIVLALRVEKMRTLSNSMDESTRRRVARETLEVFAPLANRLGVWQFKTELENLS